jgi:membrane protease YdiL (CAAX protease family)
LPIFTLYYILILGFVEELIFRGYLLNKFYKLFKSKLLAILISSTIFGLWHFPMHYHFGVVIFTFIFGIILSSLKLNIKGNIIISFAIAHGLYNSLNFWIPYLKNI